MKYNFNGFTAKANEALNQAINQMRAGKTADTDDAEDNFQALEKFTKDITKKLMLKNS